MSSAETSSFPWPQSLLQHSTDIPKEEEEKEEEEAISSPPLAINLLKRGKTLLEGGGEEAFKFGKWMGSASPPSPSPLPPPP